MQLVKITRLPVISLNTNRFNRKPEAPVLAPAALTFSCTPEQPVTGPGCSHTLYKPQPVLKIVDLSITGKRPAAL
jgi:hypothetical protein